VTIKSWRDRSKEVIWKVIREHPDASPPELKTLLREAYPFGVRRNWPYKVWCDEVRKALGIDARRERNPLIDLVMSFFGDDEL
jgi:hypothetical protein